MAQEWKIRSMDEGDSRSAVAAAERSKVTTAVWVGAAIREKIAREREGVTGEVIQPESAPAPANGVGSIDDLFRLAEMARTLTPPNKDSRDSEAMQLARSMVRDRLKALRGTEEARPRQRAIAAPAPVDGDSGRDVSP
jgi:hypothetical protein